MAMAGELKLKNVKLTQLVRQVSVVNTDGQSHSVIRTLKRCLRRLRKWMRDLEE